MFDSQTTMCLFHFCENNVLKIKKFYFVFTELPRNFITQVVLGRQVKNIFTYEHGNIRIDSVI